MGSLGVIIVYVVVIGLMMYFIAIKPQKKQQKRQQELMDSMEIGDYVLTGGELPALVIMDAVSRMVPGVLTNEDSAMNETFEDNLLEYPQYTRPEVYNGNRVPEILLSGHHANIERWRRNQSLLRTYKWRPDLFEKVVLDKHDRKFLRENGIEV